MKSMIDHSPRSSSWAIAIPCEPAKAVRVGFWISFFPSFLTSSNKAIKPSLLLGKDPLAL